MSDWLTATPDRVWQYTEPHDSEQGFAVVQMTERQILEQYGPWWRSELVRLGREHLISPENCVEDWVVVNWAGLA